MPDPYGGFGFDAVEVVVGVVDTGFGIGRLYDMLEIASVVVDVITASIEGFIGS